MEGRVEHRDVWDVRQDALGFFDRAQRRRVVQRRERLELLDLSFDGSVDQDRLAETLAAVNHAVCDRGHVLFERVDAARLLSLDDVQLQARRAGVDD
jgi:hypothetical protein